MRNPRPISRWRDGKWTAFHDLAVFNSTCPKRGWQGRYCTLVRLTCFDDHTGVAVVRAGHGPKPERGDEGWVLDFASCELLKHHLDGRVVDPKKLIDIVKKRSSPKR